MLRTYDHALTSAEKIRGQTVLCKLLSGVDALQLFVLPGDFIPNSGSVLEHGEMFTDVLANWIKQGFVAGPFFDPPFPEFRANSMMTVKQKEKVRIIMNLSSPKGMCFNDAVDADSLEKVRMATAKSIGYAIWSAESMRDCGSLTCPMPTRIYLPNWKTSVCKDSAGCRHFS
jgi:hypothetical protein